MEPAVYFSYHVSMILGSWLLAFLYLSCIYSGLLGVGNSDQGMVGGGPKASGYSYIFTHVYMCIYIYICTSLMLVADHQHLW